MNQLFENNQLLVKTISKYLDFEFKGEFNDYYIWIS